MSFVINSILTPIFLFRWFESSRIWAAGLVVSELCDEPSHWRSQRTLNDCVPGIHGINTRRLTKIIREKGTMLGQILVGEEIPREIAGWDDPNQRNLVKEVSIQVNKKILL